MKNNLIILGLTSLVALMLGGCATKVYVDHPPKDPSWRSDSNGSQSVFITKKGFSDKDIRFLFYIVAKEGKKYGANYATFLSPKPLNSYVGSPFTTVDEFLEYCEQSTLGEERPKCDEWKVRSWPFMSVKFHVDNNQSDVLMWKLDDMLKNQKEQTYEVEDRYGEIRNKL